MGNKGANNVVYLFPKKNRPILVVNNDVFHQMKELELREALHLKAKQLAAGVLLLLENDKYEFAKHPECEEDLIMVVESINSLLLKYNGLSFPIQQYAKNSVIITDEETRDYLIGDYNFNVEINDDDNDGPEAA